MAKKKRQAGTKDAVIEQLVRYASGDVTEPVIPGRGGNLDASKPLAAVSVAQMYEDGGLRLAAVRAIAQRSGRVSFPKSPEALRDETDKYLEFCAQSFLPPTIGGLALWCGVSLARLEQIGRDSRNPDMAEAVQKAKETVRCFLETSAMAGAINPVIYFHQNKCYYGAVENLHINVDFMQNDVLSESDIANRLRALRDAEVIDVDDT
jgi:hypothetical protein